MGFNMPWVGGLIYYGLECHNTMGRGSFESCTNGILNLLLIVFLPLTYSISNTLLTVYWTPYPWYIDPHNHGIFTHFSMAYQTPTHGILKPYSWYIEPPTHGNLTPVPMVHWPSTHGIMTLEDWVGIRYTMNMGFNIAWIVGSKYQG
jgi:hypothetical protein